MCREYTKEEIANELVEHLKEIVEYWVSLDKSTKETGYGILHSILCTFDGVSGDMPAFDIMASPHPDDKEYYIEDGSNYYPEGLIINGEIYLHDMIYKDK